MKPLRVCIALLTAAFAAPTLAQIIDLEWSASDRFERAFTVLPGQFAEVCGALKKGSAVKWRFSADAPSDFNIHYHVNKDVHYPARHPSVTQLAGRLRAPLDQDYCWMWSNKSGGAVRVQLLLQR
jgi:hypothetical protein